MDTAHIHSDPHSRPRAADERRAALAAMCGRHRVEVVYAFGSRAEEALSWIRGEIETMDPDGSDLDIGVKTAGATSEGDLTLDEKVGLASALEDFFAVARVDLVTFAEAGAVLAVNIVSGERLYAQSERLADEFDLYVLRRAGDLAPFERQRQAMILGLPEAG